MNHVTSRWRRPIMSSASLPCQWRIVPSSTWSCTLYKSLLLTLLKPERWSNTTRACVIWSTPELSNTKFTFNRSSLISFPLHNILSSLKITTLAVQKYLTTWPHGQFLSLFALLLFIPMFSVLRGLFCCFGGFCLFTFPFFFFPWWCDLVFFFFARVWTILKSSSPSCIVITATLHAAFNSPGGKRKKRSAKKKKQI